MKPEIKNKLMALGLIALIVGFAGMTIVRAQATLSAAQTGQYIKTITEKLKEFDKKSPATKAQFDTWYNNITQDIATLRPANPPKAGSFSYEVEKRRFAWDSAHPAAPIAPEKRAEITEIPVPVPTPIIVTPGERPSKGEITVLPKPFRGALVRTILDGAKEVTATLKKDLVTYVIPAVQDIKQHAANVREGKVIVDELNGLIKNMENQLTNLNMQENQINNIEAQDLDELINNNNYRAVTSEQQTVAKKLADALASVDRLTNQLLPQASQAAQKKIAADQAQIAQAQKDAEDALTAEQDDELDKIKQMIAQETKEALETAQNWFTDAQYIEKLSLTISNFTKLLKVDYPLRDEQVKELKQFIRDNAASIRNATYASVKEEIDNIVTITSKKTKKDISGYNAALEGLTEIKTKIASLPLTIDQGKNLMDLLNKNIANFTTVLNEGIQGQLPGFSREEILKDPLAIIDPLTAKLIEEIDELNAIAPTKKQTEITQAYQYIVSTMSLLNIPDLYKGIVAQYVNQQLAAIENNLKKPISPTTPYVPYKLPANFKNELRERINALLLQQKQLPPEVPIKGEQQIVALTKPGAVNALVQQFAQNPRRTGATLDQGLRDLVEYFRQQLPNPAFQQRIINGEFNAPFAKLKELHSSIVQLQSTNKQTNALILRETIDIATATAAIFDLIRQAGIEIVDADQQIAELAKGTIAKVEQITGPQAPKLLENIRENPSVIFEIPRRLDPALPAPVIIIKPTDIPTLTGALQEEARVVIEEIKEEGAAPKPEEGGKPEAEEVSIDVLQELNNTVILLDDKLKEATTTLETAVDTDDFTKVIDESKKIIESLPNKSSNPKFDQVITAVKPDIEKLTKLTELVDEFNNANDIENEEEQDTKKEELQNEYEPIYESIRNNLENIKPLLQEVLEETTKKLGKEESPEEKTKRLAQEKEKKEAKRKKEMMELEERQEKARQESETKQLANAQQKIDNAVKDYFNGLADLNPSWIETVKTIQNEEELQTLLTHFTNLQTKVSKNALKKHILEGFELKTQALKALQTMVGATLSNPQNEQSITTKQAQATAIIKAIEERKKQITQAPEAPQVEGEEGKKPAPSKGEAEKARKLKLFNNTVKNINYKDDAAFKIQIAALETIANEFPEEKSLQEKVSSIRKEREEQERQKQLETIKKYLEQLQGTINALATDIKPESTEPRPLEQAKLNALEKEATDIQNALKTYVETFSKEDVKTLITKAKQAEALVDYFKFLNIILGQHALGVQALKVIETQVDQLTLESKDIDKTLDVLDQEVKVLGNYLEQWRKFIEAWPRVSFTEDQFKNMEKFINEFGSIAKTKIKIEETREAIAQSRLQNLLARIQQAKSVREEGMPLLESAVNDFTISHDGGAFIPKMKPQGPFQKFDTALVAKITTAIAKKRKESQQVQTKAQSKEIEDQKNTISTDVMNTIEQIEKIADGGDPIKAQQALQEYAGQKDHDIRTLETLKGQALKINDQTLVASIDTAIENINTRLENVATSLQTRVKKATEEQAQQSAAIDKLLTETLSGLNKRLAEWQNLSPNDLAIKAGTHAENWQNTIDNITSEVAELEQLQGLSENQQQRLNQELEKVTQKLESLNQEVNSIVEFTEKVFVGKLETARKQIQELNEIKASPANYVNSWPAIRERIEGNLKALHEASKLPDQRAEYEKINKEQKSLIDLVNDAIRLEKNKK